MFYILSVTLLLFVLPAISIGVEQTHAHGALPLLPLIARWLTFWACGIRLFLAGIRQVLQPGFTAKQLFQLENPAAWPIVREVGFGNLAMGTLGIISLYCPAWLLPAAIVGGLYYGLAGIGHIFKKQRNASEAFALFTDLWVFVMLAVFICKSHLQ